MKTYRTSEELNLASKCLSNKLMQGLTLSPVFSGHTAKNTNHN